MKSKCLGRVDTSSESLTPQPYNTGSINVPETHYFMGEVAILSQMPRRHRRR